MTLRSSSIVLAVLSVVLPAAYFAYMDWSFEKWASTQAEGLCGMPIMAAFALSCMMAVLLSLTGLALGVAAFRRLPLPRPRSRLIELGVIGLPLVVCAIFLGAFALWV